MTEQNPRSALNTLRISGWAIALGAAAFFGVQAVFHLLVFKEAKDAPPFPLQVFIGILVGAALMALFLAAGYVSQDAKRRGMNAPAWTLLVIFVPNAIGFIIYFLLRQPLLEQCSQCGTTVNPSFNFCPRCSHALHPACPACKRAIQPGYAHCPYCGARLSAAA